MKKLITIEKLVENILEDNYDARINNDKLYLYVCKYFNEDVPSMSVEDFFRVRTQIGCPTFESVTRARRKLVETRTDLNPKDIKMIRKEEEKKYVEYARNY